MSASPRLVERRQPVQPVAGATASVGGGPAGEDPAAEFARAAMIGLSDRPRWLPCRYLYDAQGSRLFEAISATPAYYLTRTEAGILRRAAGDICARTGPVTLVELGAGSSIKTGHLLAAYVAGGAEVHYLPVDVSAAALHAGAAHLSTDFPSVRVTEVRGTYDAANPVLREHGPAMVVFLGSTIGNLNATESASFWTSLASAAKPGDFVLLGADLVKDARIIDAAYNDPEGYSAAFTRNIFDRMNRELDAGIRTDEIEHIATYRAAWQRVEIFARFRTDQTITLGPIGRSVPIAAGERIMTEISRKFELAELEQYLGCFGFAMREAYTDPDHWFGVLLLQRAPA